MKIILKILAALFLLLTAVTLYVHFFGTSDLRTAAAINSPQEAKAKELINKMVKAHGGESWDDVSTYTVEFKEEFYGSLGKSGNPFPDEQTLFTLSYIPNSYDGQLKFNSGENKGETWGIQSWNTYTLNNNTAVFEHDQIITFWLPTYQYFIEFPKRMLSANAFAYAGKKQVDGVDCVGVVASWNTVEPQRDIDQYLIWLDEKTKRIVKLEYTVREQYNFLTGEVLFKDYKSFNGILLPTRFPVGSNLLNEGELLHQMEILDFKKNAIEQSALRPNAEIEVMGDSK